MKRFLKGGVYRLVTLPHCMDVPSYFGSKVESDNTNNIVWTTGATGSGLVESQTNTELPGERLLPRKDF